MAVMGMESLGIAVLCVSSDVMFWAGPLGRVDPFG